jgi:hypothetical protein
MLFQNIRDATVNSINQILNLFQSHSLTNILVLGYIDNDDKIKRFNIIEKDIYLEFGEALLLCSSVNQYDQLKMNVVDKISPELDFEIEEDDELCVCSLYNMYLFDPYGTNRITSAEFLLDKNSNLEQGLVKCLGLRIGESKDYLFIDPTHTFGIQVNGKRSIEEWIEKAANSPISDYMKWQWLQNHTIAEVKPFPLNI